jgi:regulator of replication initiation timing
MDAQQKIEELTSKLKEAEEREAKLREENEKLKAQLNQKKLTLADRIDLRQILGPSFDQLISLRRILIVHIATDII